MSRPTRTNVLTLRITDQEQERLRSIADANNQTVSELVRSIVEVRTRATPDRKVPTRSEAGRTVPSRGTVTASPVMSSAAPQGGTWTVTDPATQVISGGALTITSSRR
ncbi:hypothetical protein FDO65_10250 [Nakamurella flava]|uniref:Ribbon-helix-helix protein, CopG family n=1 Tax=Nakamurella flava TaxID=2576308 RepID=A0A4U6QP94_9ACTN|nr:hypothetical protein [Nakamurella flava]TKV61896.1 hypothetical protein FDO65_10250 [Nakamurella flava]